MAPADPVIDRDEDLEAPQADAVQLRHPAIPVTLADLAARKAEGIEIIEARAQIMQTARTQGIRLTGPADYVIFKAPDGQVTAYLQDAGAQRVRDIFGIVIRDVSAPEKIAGTDPGSFHYIVTGSGLCRLTGQTVERIEGGRSSGEDFCKGKSGVDLDLAVRKAARANLNGNITRELAGLKTIPVDDLTRAWSGTGKTIEQCHKGRGFGTRDERLGATREGVPDIPPPVCAVCKAPGVYREGPRGPFYGCSNFGKHPDRKWTVDAAKWIAEYAAKHPAPAPAPAAAPAANGDTARPCEICGKPRADHRDADHDYDGGGPQ
jgi:hypothetical protein